MPDPTHGLPRRVFWRGGPPVTALGFGAGAIGDPELDEKDAERLLRRAVELGIELFDTARSYGESEARLGRHLAPIRDRVLLSTKVGYGVEGQDDWTGDCIRAGIDRALRELATDRIDVVHLHSCPLDVLQRDDVRRALQDGVAAGKVIRAGYAGENDALRWALASGDFGVLQLSVNLCDQGSMDDVLPAATEQGLGVIAKRSTANAPWRFETCPVGHDAETYWQRFTTMKLERGDLSWAELALRFSVYAPGVGVALTGTSSIAHLEENVRAVKAGPLSDDVLQALRAAFRHHGSDWNGHI